VPIIPASVSCDSQCHDRAFQGSFVFFTTICAKRLFLSGVRLRICTGASRAIAWTVKLGMLAQPVNDTSRTREQIEGLVSGLSCG